MPAWWTNNVTAWVPALDSTPSWNYQRGIAFNKYRCYDWFVCMLSPTIPFTFCI